jgi:hypothetical protein
MQVTAHTIHERQCSKSRNTESNGKHLCSSSNQGPTCYGDSQRHQSDIIVQPFHITPSHDPGPPLNTRDLRALHLVIPLNHIRVSRRRPTRLAASLSTPLPTTSLRTNLPPGDPNLRLHTLALRRLHKPALLSRELSSTGRTPYRSIVGRLRTTRMLRLPVRDVIVCHRAIRGGVSVRSSFVVLHPLVVVRIRVL